MATITISRCAGGNHIRLVVTEAWGTHTISIMDSDIALERMRTDRDLMDNIRSVVRASGASTPAQIKAVIEATTFNDTNSDPIARDYP